MAKRENALEEFMELLKGASTDKLVWVHKLLLLYRCPGFTAALKEATPPGEETPPLDVINALVDEWAEKEGL